jgi:transcriptional regulator with XRE-family HTH domain
MEFGERLRQLRLEKEMYQKELAKIIGVSESAISAYEKGIREPEYSKLKELAKFFAVSIDYLIGVSDIKEGYSQFLFPILKDVNIDELKKIYQALEKLKNKDI